MIEFYWIVWSAFPRKKLAHEIIVIAIFIAIYFHIWNHLINEYLIGIYGVAAIVSYGAAIAITRHGFLAQTPGWIIKELSYVIKERHDGKIGLYLAKSIHVGLY